MDSERWVHDAILVLDRVSALDRYFAPGELDVEVWARQLARLDQPVEAVLAAVEDHYAGLGEKLPENRLGAVIGAVKKHKKEQSLVHRAPALESPKGPSRAAYATEGIIRVPCGACGAKPGDYCVDDKTPRQTPHMTRTWKAIQVKNRRSRK